MKTNKFYITLAVIFTAMGLNANAQTCGVYKTYEDYTNGKMEVSIDCAAKEGKIKPNDFFKKEYSKYLHTRRVDKIIRVIVNLHNLTKFS